MTGRVLLLLLASVLADSTSATNDSVDASSMLKASLDCSEKDRAMSDAQLSALANMPLQHRWAFWKDMGLSRGLSRDKYLSNLVSLEPFSQYSDFIHRWEEMINASLPHFSSIHLFQDGIRPLWEDAANKNGGRIILAFHTGYENEKLAMDSFAKVAVAMISSRLTAPEDADQICGCTLAFREQGGVLSIWNRAAHPLKIQAVKNRLAGLLNTSESVFGYKSHRASMAVNTRRGGGGKRAGQAPRKFSKGVSKWFAGSAPRTVEANESWRRGNVVVVAEVAPVETPVVVEEKEDVKQVQPQVEKRKRRRRHAKKSKVVEETAIVQEVKDEGEEDTAAEKEEEPGVCESEESGSEASEVEGTVRVIAEEECAQEEEVNEGVSGGLARFISAVLPVVTLSTVALTAAFTQVLMS